jgi:hypothetical protein
MRSFILTSIIILLSSLTIYSQNRIISGRVIDKNTHEALPFVNIVYNERGNGTVSDIDGNFKIDIYPEPSFLKLSYVGYFTKQVSLSSFSDLSKIEIELVPRAYSIEEVRVMPGENPAHRIIKLASENRKINNPEDLNSFSYLAYNKMYFTYDMDSMTVKKNASAKKKRKQISENDSLLYSGVDSSEIKARKFANEQYLFLMEAINSRKFMKPDLNKEEIIASRVSGFKKPSFVMLASQFQSFSFYDDYVTIGAKKYLNPLSKGSLVKYHFRLEDTLYTERGDTVFIISFRPYENRNFAGLKGVLYINSYKYAVQNVLAEASVPEKEMMTFSIQQQYKLIDNQYWFPSQLSTNIVFNNLEVGTSTKSTNMLGFGKSWILNVRINPELKHSEFDEVTSDIKKDAYQGNDSLWNAYRYRPLTEKEIKTYEVVDSVGQAHHFDQLFGSLETLMTGYLPTHYFNIKLASLIDFNDYEGWRLGIGGKTNKNVSGYFSVGGHVAYGFKDKAFKYGANVSITPFKDKEYYLSVRYLDDLAESGGYSFLGDDGFLSTENYRKYLVEDLVKLVQKEVVVGGRALKYLQANLFLSRNLRTVTNDYMYAYSENNPSVSVNSFRFTEAGIRFRYAFREGYTVTPGGNKFPEETKYPVISGNLIKGMKLLDGNYDYLKLEAKITKNFTTKGFGQSKIQLTGGFASGDLPYPILYNGHGSYRSFTIESDNSFATMRMNEFLSDRFVSLYFSQNFGKLLFRSPYFHPDIVLANNIGFGNLSSPEKHRNIDFKTMGKGYFECGLMINNLLRQRFFGYGFGVFYRYGPYSFSKQKDNFAYKFTLSFNL